MPLAGTMKLNHFILAVSIGSLGIIGSCLYCAPPQSNHRPTVEPFMGNPLTSSKVKDALPKASFKLNIYQDEGFTGVNRAKVDIDRDGKWDEKWSVIKGEIWIEISPTDNEDYSKKIPFGKTIEAIESKDFQNSQQTEIKDPPPISAIENSDKIMIAFQRQSLSVKKKKDAVAGPFKVNLYQDTGETQINRAKLDLDRDGKWDQKWTYKSDDSIAVKISTNDDDNYDKSKEWKNGAWVK